MNTALQTFEFQSHQLTAITDEHGEPWFIAKEVAEILEYSDAHKMTSKLDDDEVQNRQIRGSGFNNKGTIIINESGLWSSVLRSTKPEAKAVKKWLTSEVLPSIRKTGGFQSAELVNKLILLNENYIQLLHEKLARTEKNINKHTHRKHEAAEIAAVVRYRAEGYTYADIAELLGRSHDAVKHMMRKAKGRERINKAEG